MDILVIGNGFDLAHGLKTTYKDFLEYCNKKGIKDCTEGTSSYKTLCEQNLWMKHFITRQDELGDTWIDLEKEIYRVIEELKDIFVFNENGYAVKCFPSILGIQNNLINFNFNAIIGKLTKPNHKYNTGKREYLSNIPSNIEELSYIYIQSHKGFINFLYDQLREFTKAFENYLTENICSTSNIKSKYILPLKTSELFVLSFNYTDICENLYHYNCNRTNQNMRIRPIYIHGKIGKTDDCKLVLGTHSFKNSSNGNNIPVDFNIFQKHNQRHKYGTIEAYQDFLRILTAPNRIIHPVFHVVGHSLDKTDHNILKHIFLANKNAIINVYYHDEESQERLIHNITEIIEEKEVMTRVRMIYQHDDNRGILLERK